MVTSYDVRKKIELYGILLLILIVVSYGGFRAYPLIAGPKITVYNPKDGDTVSPGTFELSGKVTRVKEITINGRAIPIGTDGHFTEILIAQAPYTLFVISATDFYKKIVTTTIRVSPK